MPTIKSKVATGVTPTPVPSAQEVMSLRVSVALTAGFVIAANVVELVNLPAGCVPVGYVINADDLDTNAAPTVAFDFGILNDAGLLVSTGANDGGAKWVTASTLAQAGGLLLETASKAAYGVIGAVKAVDANRKVGIVFTAGALTGAAGNIELELFYKSA